MDELLGSRYVLGESLGQGGMGQVFKGRMRGSDTPVAVKILRSELMSDPTAVAGLLQERSILTSLDDPNLVRVLDLVLDGDRLAIVMEYVEGEDLRQHLRRVGTLRPAAAARLAIQLLQGVATIHEAGVIHRDIKPENILLDSSSDPAGIKLTDLGVAFPFNDSFGTITKIIGTPHYMAPEVAGGQAISPAVDIYSVGIVLYEMLVGRPPFTGSHPLEVLAQHRDRSVSPILGLNARLWSLINAMLAKNPAARPPAPEAARALAALVPSLDQEPESPPFYVGGESQESQRPSVTSTAPEALIALPRLGSWPGAAASWIGGAGAEESLRFPTMQRPTLSFPVSYIHDRSARDSPAALAPDHELREEEIRVPGAVVRRFDVGDHEFLLIDRAGDALTLNWTTRITVTEFAGLVKEFNDLGDDEGRATISMDGVIEDMDPQFALKVALMDSRSFDAACQFFRLDSGGTSIAFQVIPHRRRHDVKIFGISARALEVSTVFPLLVRTGTDQIVAHALVIGAGGLSGRLAQALDPPARLNRSARPEESL